MTIPLEPPNRNYVTSSNQNKKKKNKGYVVSSKDDHLIHELEWTDYRYLTDYLFRLMNIDSDGKEFSKLYNLLHKNEHNIKEIIL